MRTLRLSSLVLAALVLTADLAWAEGLGLGETKEQLNLKYDVSVVDHGTGRVTVNLTIADEGRLKPLDSVDLVVPSKDGTGFVDLALSLATREVDGKRSVSVHLKRELAERAEIHLRTSSLDGKQEPLTWYYHAIPIAEYIKNGDRKNVAEGDDKPTSNDLGKIQPPGGVPLPVVGPEGEYTVDGLNKARKRMEAVPKGDLEKWVVELERIMDKKLKDGVPSARQACRTDFVIHVSVAFDDLKWNAKTADNLFKRAQTMPATEAKAWKEAFESLLKKKIGQTDAEVYDGGPAWAVPLVLIPVDALHEGQKYSVERGKKYRARLKQLTAEDVSLWKNKVDQFGGTVLDAAVNIILLDDYFDKEKFQRDKFKAAIEAPHLVTSAETADKFVGEVVAVVGEAVNGKTPNVRVTSDFYVVCVGHFQFKKMPGRQVFDWPKDILGTQVKVIGRLKKSYLGETNSLPLIESNFGYFLQDCTYERIEPQQSAAPLPRDPRTGHSEGER
jgi:hypothetical protein